MKTDLLTLTEVRIVLEALKLTPWGELHMKLVAKLENEATRLEQAQIAGLVD